MPERRTYCIEGGELWELKAEVTSHLSRCRCARVNSAHRWDMEMLGHYQSLRACFECSRRQGYCGRLHPIIGQHSGQSTEIQVKVLWWSVIRAMKILSFLSLKARPILMLIFQARCNARCRMCLCFILPNRFSKYAIPSL